MAKTSLAKMKEKKEKRKIKKQEYDKRRIETMKNDPVQAELMKEKERGKYKKKRPTKKTILAKDMAPRELRVNGKVWREKFRKWFQNNKTTLAASLIITEDSIINGNDGDNQNVDDSEHQGCNVPTNQKPCQEPSSVQTLESQIENQNEREILKPEKLSNRRGRLCFTCGDYIRTISVKCDLCAKVYHRECLNIQEDDTVPFFVCDACLI